MKNVVQAAEVKWYRQHGRHPERIRFDSNGDPYVTGDHPRWWFEVIEPRMSRDLRSVIVTATEMAVSRNRRLALARRMRRLARYTPTASGNPPEAPEPDEQTNLAQSRRET